MEFCPSGKIPYASRAEATKAKSGLISRFNGHKGLSAYECAACGSWHLGRGHVPRAAKPKRLRLIQRST